MCQVSEMMGPCEGVSGGGEKLDLSHRDVKLINSFTAHQPRGFATRGLN